MLKPFVRASDYVPANLDAARWDNLQPLYRALIDRDLHCRNCLERLILDRSELDAATGTKVVAMGPVATDPSDFSSKYEPGHPAADANGYVKYPNVNLMVETMDMREAQRSYEAGLNVIRAARGIIQSTIGILRG